MFQSTRADNQKLPPLYDLSDNETLFTAPNRPLLAKGPVQGVVSLQGTNASQFAYPLGVVAPVPLYTGAPQVVAYEGLSPITTYEEEDEDEEDESYAESQVSRPTKSPKDGPQDRKALAVKGCLCACCCGCWLSFVLPIFFSCLFFAHKFTERHHRWEEPLGIDCPKDVEFFNWNMGTNIPPNNSTRYLKWPGCQQFKGYKTDAIINSCGPPCYDSILVSSIDNFNKGLGWGRQQLVTFPSKAGVAPQQQMQLTGWWLPADDSFAAKSPRGVIPVVVVQHGTNANFNSRMVQAYAYMLRSMGFSVFLPNLRDMGSSQKSSHAHRITWGYDYYLDLLGAWEHVVKDPDGVFGGPRMPSQVGIAGMSMGAFIAGTVIGLNPEIPGVWLDSPIFDIFRELQVVVRSYFGLFGHMPDFSSLAPLTTLTWQLAKWWTGVDIGLKQPSNTLHCDVPPAVSQKVAIVYNSKDTFVRPEETQAFVSRLGEFAKCYDISELWEAASDCHGEHCTMIFQQPQVYRQKACHFWSATFGRDSSVCNVDALPKFTAPLWTPPAKASSSDSSGSSLGPGSFASLSDSGGSIGSGSSSSR